VMVCVGGLVLVGGCCCLFACVICWYVFVCVGVFWYVLVCVGMCWCVLVCVDIRWYALICVGNHTRTHTNKYERNHFVPTHTEKHQHTPVLE